MDIVKRLRELLDLERSFPMCGTSWYGEAADEIERLRKENKRVWGALREIKFRIDNMPNDMPLTPNSAIFDLIRHQIILALGEKE